jgi:hypothetical protein
MPDDVENKHAVVYFLEANLMLVVERQKCQSEPQDYRWPLYDSVLDSQEQMLREDTIKDVDF